MIVEVRIYRRHDADLIMLKSYGINISKMMRLALENYVEGERIKFRLPDSHECDISHCSMLRYRLNIRNPKVIRLLKSVKRGYRNQFCKNLLRDMMDGLPLGVYLDTEEAIKTEDTRIHTDALLANTDLGLITNRKQINSETFFEEQKRLNQQKEIAVIEENDKATLEEDKEMMKDVSAAKQKPTSKKPQAETTQKKDSKRAQTLFSMFEDMRTEF